MNEILGLRLVSIHNSHFYLEVMAEIRAHLRNGTFGEYRAEFASRYVPTEKVRKARAAGLGTRHLETSKTPDGTDGPG